MRLLLVATALFSVLTSQAPRAQELTHDLILTNLRVHDGLGSKPFHGDVAVHGARISGLGDLKDSPCKQRIDMGGLHLAPGFIDTHAHADASVLRRPKAMNFIAMGVTSIVTGNCGSSMRDLRQHLDQVAKRRPSLNYGSLIGHGTLRSQHLKAPRQPPNAAQLEAMRASIARQMQAGALGMSTGLIYVPGTFAKTPELIALCQEVARFGGVYATHMRHEDIRGPEAIAEALRIGKESGVHVHISHLKASGKRAHGRGPKLVAQLATAREAGHKVTADQYAYTASSTGLDVLFPSAPLAEGRVAFARRLAEDEAFREEMVDAALARLKASGFADFAYCQVAYAPNNTQHNGKRLDAIASAFFGETSPRHQARAAVRLFIESKGRRRVDMVYHKMREDDVEAIMRADFIGVACDAGIRSPKGSGVPHPRGAGNNARVLGRYVRERKVLSLPLALRKMCSLPAEIFGLRDRGVIRVGAFADLVVFDPAKIADRATYAEPRLPPTGIRAVYVNGQLTMQDNKHTGAQAGMVLRRGPRTQK